MRSNKATLANGVATYRLQLNKDFTFQDATAIVDYLRDLGISHLYLSPILESVSGSNHGYDVTDFTRVSAERGGEDALLALDAAVRAAGLGILLDIVPNHMASSLENPFWCDVLTHGKSSRYWKLFDFRLGPDDKVHLPILAEQRRPGMVTMRAGKNGAPVLFVNDCEIPVATATADRLRQGAAAAGQTLDYYLKNLPANLLEQAIAEQSYILTAWTEAAAAMSYRRFFNITELVGLRMEDPAVFAERHAKLFDLLRACPAIQGLRVDHIDGLLDPTGYLQRLAETGLPVWVEKILSPGEAMRPDWPVRGTTGYEFGEKLHPVFTQTGGFILIEDYWRRHVETAWPDFPACVFAGKSEVLEKLFQPEVNRLAKLSGADPALWTGLTTGLPVYRTYMTDGPPDAADQKQIAAAIRTAKKYQAWPATAAAALPVLQNPQNPEQQQAAREWQQLSGAVMAKGLEDTAHYRYTPLTALNEVGCQPMLADTAPFALFDWLRQRGRDWPQSLNATTTHDTKRDEDVRYRLLALTEMPGDWIALFERLKKLLPPSSLDSATVYFLLQTIVGTWPFDDRIDDGYRARLNAYLQKAMREAKRRTSWNAPDKAYEDAAAAAIDLFLKNPKALDDLRRFMPSLIRAGALNALSAQAIKILSPGIPDLYQGTELWNLSLVDPDNRRAVDYAARRVFLREWQATPDRAALLHRLGASWRDGAIKLWLTQQLLSIRRDRFLPLGDAPVITAVDVQGDRAAHVLAYTLTAPGQPEHGLLVAAPRFTAQLLNRDQDTILLGHVDWRETSLLMAASAGENLLTGEKLEAADVAKPQKLFAGFPLAVVAF